MPRPARTASLADAQSAPGGAAAVDRALTLLRAFRAGDAALSLAELAQRTGLYKSTALRLLASLQHAGLLARGEDGRYAVGAEIARLAALHAESFSAERVVMPVLRRLVALTGESAAWHVAQGDGPQAQRLCLFRVDSPNPVRDHQRAGDLLPLARGAGGRVLVAFDPARAKAAPRRDRALLAAVRERGCCAAVGDRLPEVAGISAPVFSHDGRLAAALTLTMPAHRYDERWIAPVVQAAQGLCGRV